MRIRVCIFAIAVATGCAHSRSSVSSSVHRTVSIAGSALRTHVAVLSDDSLEGRLTGSPGYAAAARYVANEFRKANLEPGNNGNWFQNVPLRRRDVHPDSTRIILTSTSGVKQFALDYDFVTMYPGKSSTRMEAPIVFVGQGITVPGRHDDYSDVDARGKIVAFIPGTPATLTRDERAFYESTKLRNAAEHGAIATLRLWTPEEERTATWRDDVAEYRVAHVFDFVLDLPGRETGFPEDFESLWLGPEASRLVLGASRDSRGNAGVSARIDVAGQLTRTGPPNVIGLLRGSDRRLRDDFIVVSAHLDHLGIGPGLNGDSIYNGAVDNASGVGALIELARAFASGGKKPRRSVLFVAFTGEEPGSLGSEFFVRHPPVAFDKITANINIDGVSVWPFDGLVPRGAEHSTLSAIIKASAGRRGVTLSPDPTPDRYTIAGSDQYSFMTHGIPSVIFGTARSGAARQAALDWVRNRYHKPSDDMSQPLDFEAAAKFTEALYLLIVDIADAPERPKWISGDFFERAH